MDIVAVVAAFDLEPPSDGAGPQRAREVASRPRWTGRAREDGTCARRVST